MTSARTYEQKYDYVVAQTVKLDRLIKRIKKNPMDAQWQDIGDLDFIAKQLNRITKQF